MSIADQVVSVLDQAIAPLRDGRIAVVLPMFQYGVTRIGHLYFERLMVRSLFPQERYQLFALHEPVSDSVRNSTAYRTALRDVIPIYAPEYFQLLAALRTQPVWNQVTSSGVATYLFWSFYFLHNKFAEAVRGGLSPVYLSLDEDQRRSGARMLQNLGISPETPIVTLHVREAGFADDADSQAYRNADILNYVPAIEHLTARGIAVVRLGDTSMTRLPPMGPLVVDAAVAPILGSGRMGDGQLELYAIERSLFYCGMASGPVALALALNRPVLLMNTPISWNVTQPNPRDLIVFRTYRDRTTGRPLSFLEVALHPIFDLVDTAPADKFGMVVDENAPEMIHESTVEMLDRLSQPYEASPCAEAQAAEFRRQSNWLTAFRQQTLSSSGHLPGLNRAASIERLIPTFATPWVTVSQSFLRRNAHFLAVPDAIRPGLDAYRAGPVSTA